MYNMVEVTEKCFAEIKLNFVSNSTPCKIYLAILSKFSEELVYTAKDSMYSEKEMTLEMYT